VLAASCAGADIAQGGDIIPNVSPKGIAVSEIIPLRPALPKSDTFWAVLASQGKHTVIANIYMTQKEAEADWQWRVGQVSAYSLFLRTEKQDVPVYRIEKIKRSDLPRNWAPLPALGMLRGKFI